MMKVRYRDMSEAELSFFKKMVPTFWKRLEGFILKLIVVFMLSFIPFLLINEGFELDLVNEKPILFLWVAISVAIALFLSWREERNWYTSIQHQELIQQQVEEIQCKSHQVVMKGLPEQIDFGFYFELEDARLLFIEGKSLISYIEQGSFPNTDFTLIRTPSSKTFLDIQLKGAYLPPLRHLPGFSHDDYKSGEVPLDGEVVQLSMAELA